MVSGSLSQEAARGPGYHGTQEPGTLTGGEVYVVEPSGPSSMGPERQFISGIFSTYLPARCGVWFELTAWAEAK